MSDAPQVIRTLSASHFSSTVMNSFMSQLDEVLVRRVLEVQRELGDISDTFQNLSGLLSSIVGEFDRNSREARDSAERIHDMNLRLEEELRRSGTDLEGMNADGLLIIPYGHPRNRVFEGWRDTGLVLA